MRWLYISERRPILLNARSSKCFITFVVCFAIFTDAFLYGVIVPVIPFALTARANVASQDVQHWTSILLAVYGAAVMVGALICGWLADRSESRRAPLLGGLLVLVGATLMLCLGRSEGVLVAGRLLQGLSAAVIGVVGLALIADTAVADSDTGQAMGYVALSYTMGILISPLLGGVAYAKAGYYAVFYMTFAVIAFDILLRLVLVEKKIAAKWERSNELEIETGFQIQHNRKKEDNTVRVASGQPNHNSAIAQRAEVIRTSSASGSNRSKHRSFLIFWKSKRMLAAFWGTFVTSCLITAFDATLPLRCHKLFGWDSLGSGLIFLAVVIPSFSGPYVGKLCDKYGPRWLAALGLALALPFWVLLRLVNHNSLNQKILLVTLLMLIGMCVALILPAVMAEFTYIVDAKEKQSPGIFGPKGAYAQAYGVFNVAWASGALVGPVWAGYVESAAGWCTMTWSVGLFSFVSAVPVALFTGGLITRRKHHSASITDS